MNLPVATMCSWSSNASSAEATIATVRDVMGWTESLNDEIPADWSRFQQMAREQNKKLDPVAFAWTFGVEFSDGAAKFN